MSPVLATPSGRTFAIWPLMVDLRRFRPKSIPWTMLISVLLHVGLVLILWTQVIWPQLPEQPQAISVDIVPDAPKRKPPPPPPPEPEQPPKPQEQQPQQRSDPKPEVRPVAPIQFEKGKLGKTSKSGKLEADRDSDSPQQEYPRLVESPRAPPTEPMSMTRGQKRLIDPGIATQNERDLLLTQILARWKRPMADFPEGVVVQLRVRVLADGYLADPFDGRARYAPQTAIVGFAQMRPDDLRAVILETLYLAIRVAQPLTLPPELRAKAPFETVLDFNLSDAR